ncbi:MAG: hypothetical protein IPP74_07070 [Alphaproteobacteria bacterium]|nr:hypothetical protein [Alphaproteobacteria bacterium]
MQGPTEILGAQAEYVVANPNGISCNGCGFIHTPRVTLTTGTPSLNAGGGLDHINVEKGTVTVEGAGLNASQTSALDILSRAADIRAAIYGGDSIHVIAGRNQVDYNTRGITLLPGSSADKPTVAVDSSELGGMYAGKSTSSAPKLGWG